MQKKPFVNHLMGETSPYLKQHVHNPVDWYPWGPEAFMKALVEDKPIFLSIGYSTCHWCHVMAHESFEDPEVAGKMNDSFISIKVDREERPDIDSVYMKASIISTGKGGWPLTVIMTPKGEPFFMATYIPKNDRFGSMGLLKLIEVIDRMWKNDRSNLIGSSETIKDALRSSSIGKPGEGICEELVEMAHNHFKDMFDEEHGGFGGSPKFPSTHNLIFLLRYGWRSGDRNALEMAAATLKAMRKGGIYDHIGGGFHRYSTDRQWRLPHFEKMLYDQAMMSMAYLEAYLATGNPIFKETVEGTIDYVLRDLVSEEGGFFSAEDADSDGDEGKFHVWTFEEIKSILGKEAGDHFSEAFDIRKNGNFRDESTGRETGTNVLFLKSDPLDPDMKEMLRTLGVEREKRIRPSLDDKVLADWNSLMISALSRAYQVLGSAEYLDAAMRAASLLKDRMMDDEGRVKHVLGAKGSFITGFLDDHSFLLNAFMDLYESTFRVEYLQDALKVANSMIDRFWDEEGKGFFLSPRDGEKLLVREKEAYDGAYPSGNSMAMMGLIRLSRMTGDTRFEEIALEIGNAFSTDLKRAPWGSTQMLIAFMHAAGPSREIVIAGRRNLRETGNMLKVVRSTYFPSKVVLLREPGDDELSKIAPYASDSLPINDKTTVYVCQGWNCDVPTIDPEVLEDSLEQI